VGTALLYYGDKKALTININILAVFFVILGGFPVALINY